MPPGQFGQTGCARRRLSRQPELLDGAIVKKNDLLFTIQQDQYKAQLVQAQAQVQAAQAAIVYATTEVSR